MTNYEEALVAIQSLNGYTLGNRVLQVINIEISFLFCHTVRGISVIESGGSILGQLKKN
jgi:outer membrane translocation and assembly module TamA